MGKKPEIIREKLKNKIIRHISRLFETKKEERKKKMHNGRINKDRIVIDTRQFLKQKKKKKK